MKKLIVHSQNTFLNSENFFKSDEQFVFNMDWDITDVDFYIHDQLVNKNLGQKIKECDIVFIKVGLTQNFMEYYGMRLAYHIRMTNELGNKRYLPIVLISQETCQFLGLTNELSQILFTEGIYLMEDNQRDLEKYTRLYNENKLKSLEKIDDFLYKARVKPCSEHDSHHAIANEWSLLRWCQILNISELDNSFRSLRQSTEGLLYYKYLSLKNPIFLQDSAPNIKINGKGKVLYIDDEWNKGWNTIFKYIFNQNPHFQFKIFEYDFTDKVYTDANSLIVSEIKNFDPEIVILDLRLFKEDFGKDKASEELSGFKILKEIKKINEGIQVIIFTASNKVWNFQKLNLAGADYFILKNSPENTVKSDSTSDSINNFVSNIQRGSKKAFLKELVLSCRKISQNLSSVQYEDGTKYESFLINLKRQLKICFSAILLIDIERPVTIDIAFLSFYNLLELFQKYYLDYGSDSRFILGIQETEMYLYEFKGNQLKRIEPYIKKYSSFEPPLSFFLVSLFIDYFEIDEEPYLKCKSIIKLGDSRNSYFHGTKENFTVEELKLITKTILDATSKLKE